MPNCILLNNTQKDALIANGWTLASGPFQTETACLNVCGSSASGASSSGASGASSSGTSSSSSSSTSNISTPCCANNLPNVLHASMNNIPSCPCSPSIVTLVYGTYTDNTPLTYTGWVGSFVCGGITITIVFQCGGSSCQQFNTLSFCNGNGNPLLQGGGAPGCTCNPLNVVIGLAGGGCGACNTLMGDSFTITT